MQDACQIALSKVNYLINRLSSIDYDVVTQTAAAHPCVRVLQLMRNVRGPNDPLASTSFRELGLGGYPYMPMRSAWRLFNRTFHAGSGCGERSTLDELRCRWQRFWGSTRLALRTRVRSGWPRLPARRPSVFAIWSCRRRRETSSRGFRRFVPGIVPVAAVLVRPPCCRIRSRQASRQRRHRRANCSRGVAW